MLSNATIGDRLIVVEPYYKDSKDTTKVDASSQLKDDSAQERGSLSNNNSEDPSSLSGPHKPSILLMEFSSQAATYLEKAREETKKLDEKFHVTERAAGIDSKFGIREKLNQ
ncbi:hypothetical protein L0F63_004749, partial [Massospora cicadina]